MKYSSVSLAVPSPPHNLQLRITQDDPPIVSISWSTPRSTFGSLEGFRVAFGIKGESSEERVLTSKTFRFSTGFLGTFSSMTVPIRILTLFNSFTILLIKEHLFECHT